MEDEPLQELQENPLVFKQKEEKIQKIMKMK